MSRNYSFTQEDAQRAFDEWGANCGPNALAFALGLTLDAVRGVIPEFEAKRYTSPTMMKAALLALGVDYRECRTDLKMSGPTLPAKQQMFYPGVIALTRIQWTGPWTKPGVNPKWAYRQTHWIATWREWDEHHYGEHFRVFDCNCGIVDYEDWMRQTVPMLVGMYPRADGNWFPTHIWRIKDSAVKEATSTTSETAATEERR